VNALLHAELLKLRTTRTFGALAGVAVATSVVIALLVALLTEPTADSVLTDVYASDTSSFFVLILAVIGISGEWRHRTITSSLLAAPDRRRFLTAKTIAFAVAGVALSLLIAVGVSLVATVVLATRGLPLPDPGELLAQYGRNAFVAAALGALGVAFGALLRNQIVAVVGLLVVMAVVEPLLLSLVPSVGRFGPLNALPVAAAGLAPEDAGMGDVDLPSVPLAVLAMVGWIALVGGAGLALLQRRDLE
jgi:ABC-2 type transport system permease protein